MHDLVFCGVVFCGVVFCGVVFCGVVFLCSLNVNTSKFALFPLWIVCMKKLMVSVMKLGSMDCLCGKNDNISNFALSPLCMVVNRICTKIGSVLIFRCNV